MSYSGGLNEMPKNRIILFRMDEKTEQKFDDMLRNLNTDRSKFLRKIIEAISGEM